MHGIVSKASDALATCFTQLSLLKMRVLTGLKILHLFMFYVFFFPLKTPVCYLVLWTGLEKKIRIKRN